MKAERLFNCIDAINDDYIHEAESFELVRRRYISDSIRYLIAAGLMVSLIVFATQSIGKYLSTDKRMTVEDTGSGQKGPDHPGNTSQPVTPDNDKAIKLEDELPKLKLYKVADSESGFEGYIAHDIDELKNTSPWKLDWNLKVLPVYANTYVSRDSQGIPNRPDYEAMKEKLYMTAKQLGYDRDQISLSISDNEDYYDQDRIDNWIDRFGEVPILILQAASVTGSTDELSISVDVDLSVTIRFNEPLTVSMPSRDEFESERDFFLNVLETLHSEYNGLLETSDPVFDLGPEDYSYDGDVRYVLKIWNGEGDRTEQLINSASNFIEYRFNKESSSLINIYISNKDGLYSLGSYPIVTVDEAKDRLISGFYSSTAPIDFPGEEYISKVELTYRHNLSDLKVPFYKFYVDLNELVLENGLKTYGVYYVPAMRTEFFEVTPDYFN